MDISIDYGTGRDLAIATRSSAGNGRIFMTNMGGFSSWRQQAAPSPSAIDYFSLKFSPTYNGDQSYVVILTSVSNVFYNIGIRDAKEKHNS